MLKALMQVQKVQQSSISSKWESLLNNLGHTARKLGKLEDALKYHQQALVLKPKSSSTYSAIGKKSVREIYHCANRAVCVKLRYGISCKN